MMECDRALDVERSGKCRRPEPRSSSLDAKLARARHLFALMRFQIVESVDLAADEAAFEISVDDPGRLRGRRPDRDQPRRTSFSPAVK